jgi:hypothetical protein
MLFNLYTTYFKISLQPTSNPNLKAEDMEYWKSLVNESKNNMSYPIQAAAIHEEDTPCPTDDSSDAPSESPSDVPSGSPSDAPSVSPVEVVLPLEVSMSYSMSYSMSIPSTAPSGCHDEVEIPLEVIMSYDMSIPIQEEEAEEDATYANPN